ncbi:MAG: 4Fe-4S cluster-binding domain-containing protein [Spirochaetaceae bacterium]|nr:4Fe-4S cluster-binding domain-containing protein [Spirochaetaceae bacterium]
MTALRIAHLERGCEVIAPEPCLGVWVQGCSIRCEGCSAKELWSIDGGRDVAVAEIVALAAEEGALAVLGGEPVDQVGALFELCAMARDSGLGVTLYTGYERDSVLAGHPWIRDKVDLLLAGPYVASERSEKRPFVGSDNQTVDFLSPRYQSPPGGHSRCEIHLEKDGSIVACGYPDEKLAKMIREGFAR